MGAILKIGGGLFMLRLFSSKLFLFLLIGYQLVSAMLYAQEKDLDEFEAWINSQTLKSRQSLLLNISPHGTERGVVVASPSRHDPDYYYHWIRDASIVMGVVVRFYEKAQIPQEKEYFSQLIKDFVSFSRKNQLTFNRSGGLGEPKFNVDGSAFQGDWGRPQNDGPALRALTMIRYAKDLLAEGGHDDFIRSSLYDGKFPTDSMIKADLEFVSNHWPEASYDLWEEVKGQHFNTRMVQRKALLDGADLADELGDLGAASWYRIQAKNLEVEIEKHWDSQKEILLETIHLEGGLTNKNSGLDSGVILGSIEGNRGDGFFTPSSDKVLRTALKIRQVFQNIYQINRQVHLAPAIGRYPEDTYDGLTGGKSGNPWPVTTFGFSELYYCIENEWSKLDFIPVTATHLAFLNQLFQDQTEEVLFQPGQIISSRTKLFSKILIRLRKEGDSFLKRVQFHSPANGSFYEQINRDTGNAQGALDLTWSYAGFLRSIEERTKTFLNTSSSGF